MSEDTIRTRGNRYKLLPKHCHCDVKESGELRCFTVPNFIKIGVMVWEIVFFIFQDGARRHLGFLNFLYFIGWWCSGDRDASPIQISSKAVDALWRYSDFMIFQYDYNWPFGLQNYSPHYTHTSTLTVHKFWSAFYTLPFTAAIVIFYAIAAVFTTSTKDFFIDNREQRTNNMNSRPEMWNTDVIIGDHSARKQHSLSYHPKSVIFKDVRICPWIDILRISAILMDMDRIQIVISLFEWIWIRMLCYRYSMDMHYALISFYF